MQSWRTSNLVVTHIAVEDMVRAVTSGGVMLDITSSIKAEVKPKIE
jgi:hypothetical protein